MANNHKIEEIKHPLPRFFAEDPLSSCKGCPMYCHFAGIGWACNLVDPLQYKECYLHGDPQARIGISRSDFEKLKQAAKNQGDKAPPERNE